MKRFLYSTIKLIAVVSLNLSNLLIAQTNADVFPKQIKDFGANPGNLNMFLFVPERTNSTDAELPLVVALHGCSQNLIDFVLSTGWIQLAKKHNFAVIFPAQKLVNNTTRCFNWFIEKDLQPIGGECESIKSMVDFVTKNYKIDSSRLFLYGVSAGALMSINFAINFPTQVNAVASYAGGPYRAADNPAKALKIMVSPPNLSPATWGSKIKNYDISIPYPNLVIVHGESDRTVDFNMSQQLVKQWSFLHKVNHDSLKLVPNFSIPDVEKYQLLRDGKSPVVTLFKLLKTGHRIAINPGADVDQGGQKTKWTKLMKFYSTYFVCQEFGLIR